MTVLYHGRVKGVIQLAGKAMFSAVSEHPFFGMHGQKQQSVAKEMAHLRRPRPDA